MQLIDVNILVYSHNTGYERHADYRKWLLEWVGSSKPFGMSEQVLSSFMRVVTNPRILQSPFSAAEALARAEKIADNPNCQLLNPGPRHWSIFTDQCRAVNAVGNVVPDAYFAALAIEHDCEWLSADKGFARFPGLRWRHPLED